jgi:hypothetical protein
MGNSYINDLVSDLSSPFYAPLKPKLTSLQIESSILIVSTQTSTGPVTATILSVLPGHTFPKTFI